MPITDTSLSAKIVAEIVAAKGAPADMSQLQQFADAIAKAIVQEITTSAVVVGTVTSGAGAGGAVTGSIT